MGHTNSTTNYNLPQFVTTDKPAWLTDINGAFSAIDSGLHTAQTDATTAKNTADNAQTDATAAGTAASTADSKAAGAIASIANAFDTTSTYDVGDLVMYNSLLYICSTAVTTPGAWTGSTNWTRKTVEDIVPTNAGDLPLGSTAPAGSTAEAIANLKDIDQLTINNVASIVSSNSSTAFNVGGLFLIIKFSIQVNTNITGWTNLFDIVNAPAITEEQFAAVSNNDSNKSTYISAIYSGNTVTVRAPNGFESGVTYRGQFIIPII